MGLKQRTLHKAAGGSALQPDRVNTHMDVGSLRRQRSAFILGNSNEFTLYEKII